MYEYKQVGGGQYYNMAEKIFDIVQTKFEY